MKRACLTIGLASAFFMVFVVATNVVSAGCTVGVKDCRPSSPGSSTCYWWECQQTGSETTWIFTGKTCTCPGKSTSLEPPAVHCDRDTESMIGRTEGHAL
jgi:hypothetical protein